MASKERCRQCQFNITLLLPVDACAFMIATK